MTVLSDVEILGELERGGLRIEVSKEDEGLFGAFQPEIQVQPASVDLRLGTKALLLASESVSIAALDEAVYMPGTFPIVLNSGKFLLCETLERIVIPPHLAAKYEGRSSLGRIGLMSHVTSGFIDPGFGMEGPCGARLTLEMYNCSAASLHLVPGVRIGQLVFSRLFTPADRPYGRARGSKYIGQFADGVQGVLGDP